MNKLLILADEGFNGNFVKALRKQEFQVDWVLEISAGISDEEVIQLAKGNKQTLLAPILLTYFKLLVWMSKSIISLLQISDLKEL